jgi:osmotically-inducible protein OsmY
MTLALILRVVVTTTMALLLAWLPALSQGEENLADAYKASQLIVQKVRNLTGMEIGEGDELVLDPVLDVEIERKVKEGFLRDPYIDRSEIAVTVRDGTVYLSGRVSTRFEKLRAEDLVHRVTAVRNVVNQLVTPSTWAYTRDWEIRQDLEHKLWLNPLVDSQEIRVVVRDGVATLTGAVDSWKEKQLATEEAFQAGARSVRNNLIVQHEAGMTAPS